MAETGSMTRAAEALNTSQPNVTRIIAELEQRSGLTLFQRERHGMSLTDDGQRLLAAVLRNTAGLRAVQKTIDEIRSGLQGELSALAMPVVGEGVLGELLGRFAALNPGVRVRLLAGGQHDVLRAVLSGESEFGGIIGAPPAHPDLTSVQIARRSLVAVMSPRHRLADRNGLSLEDLDGETFVAMARPHSLQTLIETLMLSRGVRPALTHEAATQRAVVRLAQHGDAIGLVDSEVVEDEDPTALRVLPLDPRVTMDIHLLYSPARQRSDALSSFLVWLEQGRAQLVARDSDQAEVVA